MHSECIRQGHAYWTILKKKKIQIKPTSFYSTCGRKLHITADARVIYALK